MKKIIISAAIIAAAAVGCSKTNSHTEVVDGKTKEIRIGTSLSDLTASSKAALTSADAVQGLQILRWDATQEPTDFSAATLITADRVDDATNIAFATPQYYDPKLNAYFAGYYPAALSHDAGSVKWVQDGKTDILRAGRIDMGTDAEPLSPVLEFQHILTQFEIICIAEADKTAEVRARWGKIDSISTYRGDTVVMNLVDMYITDTNPRWFHKFVKPDYTNDFEAVDIQAPDDKSVTTASMHYSNGFAKMDFYIHTENQDVREVSFRDPSGDFKAGKRYVITLTFNTKGIEVKSTIADWTDGATFEEELD